MTQSTHRPDRLDIRSFAQDAAQISGSLPLSKLERLAQDLYLAEADLALKTLQWTATGSSIPIAGGAAQPWLHLEVSLQAPMQCQRCLQEVVLPVQITRDFRFVKNEEEANAQDDDAQEELLVIAKQFDLLELIEDEIIMALPFAPLHETCPEKVKLASSSEEFDAAQEMKPNAFAALGVLKKAKP
jgi:uncharacterized protein